MTAYLAKNSGIQNLLRHSAAFDNAAWSKFVAPSVSVTANAAAAPDGTTTADKLIEADATSTAHGCLQEVSGLASGQVVTFSIFAKAAERQWCVIVVETKSGALGGRFVNVSTGQIGATSGSVSTTVSLRRVGDFFRIALTIDVGAGSFTPTFRFLLAQSDGVDTYAGTAGSGMLVWGASLVRGSRAGPHVDTTTAAVDFGGEPNFIDIEPLHNTSIRDIEQVARHRTRGGSLFRYRWGRYRRANLEVDYLPSSAMAWVNSAWAGNELLVYANQGGADSWWSYMQGAQITNDKQPFSSVRRGTIDHGGGVIELETIL